MSTKQIPYVIKSNNQVTLFINDDCVTIGADHPNYTRIINVLKSEDHSSIGSLIHIAPAIKKFVQSTATSATVTIKDGQIFFGDYAIHNTLTVRILSMIREGFKFDHMVKFLENLLQNPSQRAVSETYRFLENYGLPITDDGHFLAYKAVRNDYKDIYSGKFDNSIGKSPTMPRNQVDEAYEQDCSHGLHVGAIDYVVQYGHFAKGQAPAPGGNRLLIVKVNPADVVSVPKYESHPKMRVCKYTVISEITDTVKALEKVVYSGKNASEIAPDVKEEELPMTEHAEDPIESDDYHQGWLDGKLDKSNGDRYGYSRIYFVGNYLKGYNDAYNGRKYLHTLPSSISDDDEIDYDAGYDTGLSDLEHNSRYGFSRTCDEGFYLKGYNDAFNGRVYDCPEPTPSPVAEDDSCDGCGCCGCGDDDLDGCAAQDSEYNAGYDTGVTDAAEGNGFETSLEIDASDAFKSGYRDGYDDEMNS